MIQSELSGTFYRGGFRLRRRSSRRSERDSVNLVDLLTDAEARDSILDHPRLFQTILEHGAPLTISPQLYFYILIRHVLKETGLNDRERERLRRLAARNFFPNRADEIACRRRATPIQYVSDMLIALRNASPSQTFLIRAHVGNYALFITGMFPDTVQSRARARRAGRVGFYEDVGSDQLQSGRRASRRAFRRADGDLRAARR